MNRVAALFVRRDSIYKALGADCYDIDRDARTFDFSTPVVAHPPCRAWGNLSHFAKPRPDERDLAWFALHVVRECGGVLEHPITSRLWREAGMLTPGVRDRFGGVLIPIHQLWWGHRAIKATGLYIVGPIPDIPAPNGEPTRCVQNMSTREREHTPQAFASWLLGIAEASHR